MRAWYLPWWVSSAGWLASPIAHSQPSATSRTRQVSSASSHDPGAKPTVCKPMSLVSAVLPVAKSTSSTSSSVPSSSETVTGPVPPGLRSSVIETPTRTSTPASARPCPTSSPTKGSIRGSRPERRASSVTSEPKPRHAVAISTATPPPPTTANRAGTELLSVALRFVHGRASAIPGRSGSAAVLPMQIATACRAVSTTVWSSGLATATRRGPSSLPCPRIRSAPVALTQLA